MADTIKDEIIEVLESKKGEYEQQAATYADNAKKHARLGELTQVKADKLAKAIEVLKETL